MGVRIDKIQASSLFEAQRVYGEPVEFSITISGTIPSGGKSFEHIIEYDRPGTILDLFYERDSYNYRKSVNNLQRIPYYAGSSNAQINLRYKPNLIRVEIFVVNFGSSYVAPTETYNFFGRFLDAPFSV